MLSYLFYIISFPIGLLVVSHIRMPRKYFWFEYWLFFAVPLVAGYWVYTYAGARILLVAMAWMVFGPFLEASIGYTYLTETGKHLWVYERMPILNKTCSWLVIPYWGIAGVGVWALNELIRIGFK